MTGAWLYTLIPLLAMVLGAAATTVRRPGPRLTSGIQHFAAGVVFAATATEILPDLKGDGAAVPVFIGGMIGLGVMLLIRELGSRASGSMGFYVTMATDILVDGLVLGIGFAAGPRQGAPQGLYAKPRYLGRSLNIAYAACLSRAVGSFRGR